jgi:hypothetical protein
LSTQYAHTRAKGGLKQAQNRYRGGFCGMPIKRGEAPQKGRTMTRDELVRRMAWEVDFACTHIPNRKGVRGRALKRIARRYIRPLAHLPWPEVDALLEEVRARCHAKVIDRQGRPPVVGRA